jgi:4-amino-4-deoxy-L-arabinose transferase
MNALNNDLPIIPTEKKSAVLLLLFFLVLYILPLGARDLFVPDETRYAEIPREMIAGGDWVVPHLNGVRYFEKPVLGYWVHAGAILLFGENNFAVRLPSAMAVGLSAFLIVMLIVRAGRKEDEKWHQGGILGAFAFLTCFGVFSVGNTAVLDNLFSFFLTATITFFYFATEAPPGSVMEKRRLLLSGVSCGLAFLTKGFLAFAVPVLVLAPYLIWQRRCKDLFRMSWQPMLAAALVALPWSIWIHLREPDFWRFFFWNEHIRRFIGGNAQHKENFWYFFVFAPGLFMPWTFMIPAAMAGIKGNLRDQGPQGRLIRMSICWLVVPFLFFSLSSGKLITYILPCFPPFAILMAFGLLHILNQKGKQKIFQWGVIGGGIFFSLILLAFVYVQLFGYHAFRPYTRPWKAMMVVNALVFMILFCFWAFRSQERITKIILFGVSPFLLFLTSPFILPDLTIQKKAPGILLERYFHDIGRDTIIISDEETVRAVCWYLKRTDIHVLGGGGELDYGLGYEDANGRATDMRSAVDLINQNQGKILLIARVKNISKWRDQLPKPVFQDDSGPKGYGFRKY